MILFGGGEFPQGGGGPSFGMPGAPDHRAAIRREQSSLLRMAGLCVHQSSEHSGGQRRGPKPKESLGWSTEGSRATDDWGALRAWAWGASRGLDYLETEKAMDAKHVGIEGVSRYGKAALVTMAFDTRFAFALIGSSGEGGAKLHRRNFGEAVESLTGAGEYHWMAGNFLKYGASEAKFGSKNAGDLPVDAHELIALGAPRTHVHQLWRPEKGDAKWLDQQGSYMATVAAGPVFKLLGARDLGSLRELSHREDAIGQCRIARWRARLRQHDGGHTDGPNWKYFITWADKFFHHKGSFSMAAAPEIAPIPADQPARERTPIL